VSAKADDEVVPIPFPYRGLTARKGDREVNVHEVREGIVYYGLYDFPPLELDIDFPVCIGLYQLAVKEFIDLLRGHMMRGDVAVFSLLHVLRSA